MCQTQAYCIALNVDFKFPQVHENWEVTELSTKTVFLLHVQVVHDLNINQTIHKATTQKNG
jgi:hypothetical protein